MTEQEFKIKHKNLIDLGVITFTNENPVYKLIKKKIEIGEFPREGLSFAHSLLCEGDDMIIVDRFTSDFKTILCEAKELSVVRRDILKMGYEKGVGMGVYVKIN